MSRSWTSNRLPGIAVQKDGDSSERGNKSTEGENTDGASALAGQSNDRDSLVDKSIKLTEGLRELVQENMDLKKKLHQLEQKSQDYGSKLG